MWVTSGGVGRADAEELSEDLTRLNEAVNARLRDTQTSLPLLAVASSPRRSSIGLVT